MEVQIEKAKRLVERNEPGRRARFVMKTKDDAYAFNEPLRQKAESLLGIKGYYTNLPQKIMSNADIVSCYRDLWHVEAAFRMSKSDLAARPIYHHKESAVRAHLAVCFVALAIGF